jgi:hypothetical protein
VNPDDAGQDLNELSNTGFYAFNTRLGLDLAGLKILNADVSAKIESDFAGYSNSSTLLRIRRAFMKFQWEKSSLLIGQEWHPMFGGVIPTLLSINTGAPFNPFNRSPQINYSYELGHTTFTGAALWQFQYASAGPNGKTALYQRNSNIPEFCLAVGHKHNDLSFGAFADYLTLRLRTQSVLNEKRYKVDERLGSFSYGAYAGYSRHLFSVRIKSVIGENPSGLTIPGGIGVSRIINATTGEQEYTNFKHSASWINIIYGKKYQAGIYAGYIKNLGSKKELIPDTPVYGDGMNMNELYRLCGTFSYNIPNFTIGLEYEFTTAVYGDGDRNLSNGLFNDTHKVGGHHILGIISYYF